MLTRRKYKQRCGQLRGLIKSTLMSLPPDMPFERVNYNGTDYIYNKISKNIIWKGRGNGMRVGILYRPTSIYRHILSTKYGTPSHQSRVRVAKGRHMAKHLGEVRSLIT